MNCPYQKWMMLRIAAGSHPATAMRGGQQVDCEVRLNPEINDVTGITAEQAGDIRKRLPTEMDAISRQLKQQSFSLYCNRYVKTVAGHYDAVIRLLIQQVKINISQYPRGG